GVNRAVNKVREALNDDADNPRFIETLSRRGYRFLVPVEPVHAGKRTLAPDPSPPPEIKPVRPPKVRQRPAFRTIAAAISATIIVGVAGWVLRHQPGRDSEDSALIARPLTTYPGSQSFPVFSPNGNQVAFTWGGPNGDNADIYVKQGDSDSL